MYPEIIDNVNKPSHYQGRFGMESIDALRNFMTPEQLKGFYLGNALKYQLRFQKKNGLEDLKKHVRTLTGLSRRWNMSEYALYQGDVFVTLGTLEEISEETGISEASIKYYSWKSYWNRYPNGRKVIKIEVDDEE